MSSDCPVCLEPLSKQSTVTSKPCEHIYHFECLNTWVKTSSQCPTCRCWLTNMELESGVQYKIEKREQSKLDFQPPTPPRVTVACESNENSETCITCLNILGISFVNCESCNSKFHLNCHDGEFCPNCGWNKFRMNNRSIHNKRSSRNRLNNFDQDENRMYSRIVDEMKATSSSEKKSIDQTVEDAWGMLDKALNDSTEENDLKDKDEIVPKSERKLKRPNSATHSLTMDALAKHDSGISKSHERLNKQSGLNYIQKLIIYRLLIKPRLLNTTPTQLYTKMSKTISRKLYKIINDNKYAMLSLNSLIEFSEREGVVLKDKKTIDNLLNNWKDNSIVKNFTSGAYLSNELGKNWIQDIINGEINKIKH